MQITSEKRDFNILISEVEDCVRSSLFSDVDYFVDLLSQENFLDIVKAVYDNDFSLTDEVIELIIKNGYRICDIHSVIECMQSGVLECNIPPAPKFEKIETNNIENEIIEPKAQKTFSDKFFNNIFTCEEEIGHEVTYCLKVASNVFDVNNLIKQIVGCIGADITIITDNEIKISVNLDDKIYGSPIERTYNDVFTFEENRADNHLVIRGEEEEIDFLFRIICFIEHQMTDRIYIENSYVKLQRTVDGLSDSVQQIRLDRIVEDEEILSFWEKNNRVNIKDLLEDIPNSVTVENIEYLVKAIYNIEERSVLQVVKDTLSKLKSREEAVLRRRYFGDSMATLESVGMFYNVSRERIRQVELKAKEKLARYKIRTKSRITDVLKLYSEYKNFFTDTELTVLGLPKCLGMFLDSVMEEVLWDVDFSVGFYNQRLNKLINQELETIPAEFLIGELEGYAKDIAYSIGEEITWQEVAYLVKRKYRQVGDFFVKGRLTLRVVLAYLIIKYFPQGLDLYDGKDLQFLRDKAKEHFDGFELSDSDHALAARIQTFCVPVARGVWKWASNESLLDEQLKADICSYVNEYNSPVVPIHAVYIAFEWRLNGVEIYNKYHLQGEIKKILPQGYSVNRDYIFKDITASFYTVLESFVKESKTLVTKKDILKNFPGVNDITIQQACAATKIINMNGYFVHLDNLAITDDEMCLLKQSIDMYLSEAIIYHAKNVFIQIKGINAGLFSRIGIEHYLQFFYLIRELFPNEYAYNRPFIAQLGVDIISGEAQVIERISANSETDISELRQYAREVGTVIDRYIEFIDRNNDTFIFKNGHTIIMLDAAGVYDDEFDNIDDIISAFLGEQQYRNLGEFYDYWKLPKLNCLWNEWVLYSLINKYSQKFKGIVSSNYLSEAIPFVARQEVKIEEIDFSSASKISVFDEDATDIEDMLDFDDLE